MAIHPRVWSVMLACACAAATARAQPNADASATGGAAPGFVQESWTAKDGLPVNTIAAIIQSQSGYIWLATFDGLVRFDGVRFATFNGGPQ